MPQSCHRNIIDRNIQGLFVLGPGIFSIRLCQSTMSQVSPSWLPLRSSVFSAKSNSGIRTARLALVQRPLKRVLMTYRDVRARMNNSSRLAPPKSN